MLQLQNLKHKLGFHDWKQQVIASWPVYGYSIEGNICQICGRYQDKLSDIIVGDMVRGCVIHGLDEKENQKWINLTLETEKLKPYQLYARAH